MKHYPVRGTASALALCAFALAACSKGQNEQTYMIPDEAPAVDVKMLDAAATSLKLADAAYAKGEYAIAAQLYYRATELSPDNAELKVKLAYALFKSGTPGDAEKIFRAALAQDARNTEALRGLAHSLVVQGRAAEAVPIYRQALVATGERDVRVHAGLGAALDMIGKHAEARAVYEAGLKLAPKDFGLRNNLAMSFVMTGETAKAQAVLSGLAADPATAPKAERSLSMINEIVASRAPAPPRQVADAGRGSTKALVARSAATGTAAKSASAKAPSANRSVDAKSRIARAGHGARDGAGVTPPPAPPAWMSRKPRADLAEGSSDDVIDIRTGLAPVTAAVRHVPGLRRVMAFRTDADSPEDAAREVIDLLEQAERGPRFVWQSAFRPDVN